MSTHDTDPHAAPSIKEADTERRDREGVDEGSAIAASLLADLARAPLPAPQVSETSGHAAASYAAPAHKPPRAIDTTLEDPAVIVNATAPLPVPRGPSLPLRGDALAVTVASTRVQRRRRVLLASVIATSAALAAALVVGFGPRASDTSGASRLPGPAASPAAAQPATASSTVAPAEPGEPRIAPAASDIEPIRVGAQAPPRSSASAPRRRPSSAPSGTFAPPDRSF